MQKIHNPMGHPLAITLSAAVPLHIMQLKMRGGPSPTEIQEQEQVLGPILERADSLLLFKGKETKDGEVADAFNKLARGIAILSYCPGGITIFNEHFETQYPEANETTSKT